MIAKEDAEVLAGIAATLRSAGRICQTVPCNGDRPEGAVVVQLSETLAIRWAELLEAIAGTTP